MPQIVAFEFDRQGIRAAVADDSGARIVRLAQAEKPDIQTADALATALREALPDVRWQRASLVAVFGGEQLRCRLLKLPPCPDPELPAMVRMQAVREFALGDQAVVDYVPLTGDAEQPRGVLAATVEDDDLELCRGAAAKLDTTLAKAVARGAAAAGLATRIAPELREGAHLIAAAAAGAADLVVIDGGEPTLVRSTRTPADAIASEARRTAAMAAQQSGRKVDSTCLLGAAEQDAATDNATNGLAPLDLAGYLSNKHGLTPNPDAPTEQLAGVIAAAIDEALDATPALDFLHPRRPVVDRSDRRRLIVLAAAAAAALLAGVALDYSHYWKLQQDIVSKKERLKQEAASAEKWTPVREQVAAIDGWLATDVNWLDELERLGRKLRPQMLDDKEFPAETDAYLVSFTATRSTLRDQTGGKIDLRAVSRSPYSYDELEQRLRDEHHQVETSQGTMAAEGGAYRWETQTALRVEKPSEEELP